MTQTLFSLSRTTFLKPFYSARGRASNRNPGLQRKLNQG